PLSRSPARGVPHTQRAKAEYRLGQSCGRGPLKKPDAPVRIARLARGPAEEPRLPRSPQPWLRRSWRCRRHDAPFEKEVPVQIKISARHGHLSEATRQFIHEKAEKLLHFFDRLMMIEVLVDVLEGECVVEFLVSAEHKHDFVASERNKDLLAA